MWLNDDGVRHAKPAKGNQRWTVSNFKNCFFLDLEEQNINNVKMFAT